MGAFSDCTNLTSVTIPNSVTYIGDWAFSNCESLISVTIYSKKAIIEDDAFSKSTTINGYKDSTAESYAKKNGNKFVALTAECTHTWDNGKITKAATCTATGVKTYTCSKCKATKTETIKATGHKSVTDKEIAATCTKA